MKLPTHIMKIYSLFLLVFVTTFLLLPAISPVHAGSTLSNLSDSLSSITASDTNVVHTISFKITSAVGTTIQVTTSSAWGTTPSTTAANYTVTVNSSPVTVTSVSSSTTSFTLTAGGGFGGSTGQVVVVTALSTAAITNQAAGSYTETITTGGGETGVLGMVIVSNDQVALTATVGQTISFSLSSNSVSIPNAGNLSIASENTSNTITLTLSTNAANGYAVTVQDLNGNSSSSLYSAPAAHTFPQAPSGNAATLAAEGFGMGSVSASSGTIPAQFLATTNQVGKITTSAVNFWTGTGAVSAATATPFFGAYASATTPAGNYTDNVTFIATATF